MAVWHLVIRCDMHQNQGMFAAMPQVFLVHRRGGEAVKTSQMKEYRDAHGIREVGVCDITHEPHTVLHGDNGLRYQEIEGNIWMDVLDDPLVAYLGTGRHQGGIVLRPLYVDVGDKWVNATTGRDTTFSARHATAQQAAARQR